MRRRVASVYLRFHVWFVRHHAIEPGYNRCGECYGVWPCRMRRETDELTARLAGVSR